MNQDPRNIYAVGECIGRGTFGDVYKCTEKATGNVYAIKVVNLEESEEEISVIAQEIVFLSQLKSPYITSYINTYVKSNALWIVMEYCQGGSCSDLLRCFKVLDEEYVALIIRDALRGLAYLHGQNKIHRDTKAANILITDAGMVKLADFGVSGETTISHQKKHTFVGTPLWMAPEVILRKKTGYDNKCDIWSIGITTIELILGVPPLSEYPPMKVLFDIPNFEPPILVGPQYSKPLKRFVKKCLQKDPDLRPPARLLLATDPFLSTELPIDSLAQLVAAKNDIMKNMRTKPKKPRYSLDNSPDTSMYPTAWSFSTKFKNPKPLSASPRLLEVTEISTQSPASSDNAISPKQKTSSRFSGAIHRRLSVMSRQRHAQQKENISVLKPITDNTNNIQAPQKQRNALPSAAANKIGSAVPTYITGGMMELAFRNIRKRAKDEKLKSAVDELFQLMLVFEKERVPGLFDVLCEELYLKIKEHEQRL